MTEESAVKVCVRVRPLIAREESSSEDTEPVHLFWKADKKSIHQLDDGNSTKSFSFDRVFIAEETTKQLYQDIAKPLVVSTVQGYNGTIFAYGQTSSGKTFTMMGNNPIPGVIPLAVEDVFQTIKNCPKKEFLLRVSYMEIYNETVTDLLVDSWKRKPLEVRETINKNIYVADLTEELVTSPAQALAWIRKGEKNRHYGKTKMNQRSSRSHTIFRMILESRERSDLASGENADGAIIVSHLNLVDLAGSERASQTGAEGTRFKEGCNINRSLFTLGQVIKKLTDEGQRGFTNYRDSKLTRILQNSLGGNAKTVIICTITPVTLDETLSTLQFASTAKKMKNDPHVTEVSDDGALLKRYRNEIVDLKRRLHEVSSVTQTTATEKEVLSQLLQEKDHLQREQEDRIRNLTKLLVTSSNLVPAQRMPKRRVTWGGKMLRLVRASSCEGSPSNLSFAESLTRKRKADCSNLTELVEDDEDFDSQWEIPDEPPDDMEMSQGAVTVRTSADRLDSRVVELQLQLQTLEQQKQEAAEKLTVTEQSAATLCLQLHTESQQKLEAVEKVEMLELAVAELERRVREEGNSDIQMRRELAETVQLCETLATEKDVMASERDYLKQELGLFIEQTESLEREKASLSLELQKKRELDEFESLEEEVRKEHESELQSQMVSLKMAKESSELQCLALQKKLDTVSQELKEKTRFAEDLQSMSGKDLVQEVTKLRRSLDDAEVLSRDTKKEWAILRSQNISLEEMKLSLAASHERMEAEVGALRSQLEAEKSQYRKMQKDLQKELNAAFVENNKFLTLLEGKVPKDVMDCVQLERSVSSLHQELTASREAEGALREQLEELASLRALPDQMSSMTKQLEQLTKELGCVRAEKDALLSDQNVNENEIKDLLSTLSSLTSERDQLKTGVQQNVERVAETQASLQALQEDLILQGQKSADLVKLHEQEESEYEERIVSLSEELQGLREDKEAGVESSAEERRELLSTLTAERDQLKVDLQENVEMMIELQEELRTALEKSNEQQKHIKDLETAPTSDLERATSSSSSQLEELQTQVKSLSEELDSMRADRDLLQSQRPTQEMEVLHSTLTSLTEERDQLQEILEGLRQEKQQLREELEDRIHTVTEAQAGFMQAQTFDSLLPPHEQRAAEDLQQELTATLHAFGKQKVQHEAELQLHAQKAAESQRLLQALQGELQQQAQRSLDLERSGQEQRAQLEQQVTESEDALRSLQESFEEQIQKNADLLKIIQHKESDLEQQTKELELLQVQRAELLDPQEVEKLRSTLTEDRKHLLQQEQQLRAQLQDRMEEHQLELAELRASLQTVTEQKRRLEDDLLDSRKMASTAQDLLKTVQQEQQDQKQLSSDLMSTLQSSQAERDVLLAEREATRRVSAEEQQKLLSVSGERDQLQEILQVMRQEKQQLNEELEDKMRTLREELEGVAADRDGLHSACQSSREEVEQLRGRLRSESEELLQLQETLEKKEQLRSQLEDQLSSMEEKLHEQEELMLQQQSETGRQETTFQQEVLTQEPKQTSLCGLQDSMLELQESFRRFQQFFDICSQYDSSAMEKELGPSPSHQSLLPQENQRSYRDICQLQLQTLQHLGEIGDQLQERAKKYRDLFEQLVQRDLCVFEEHLLQDVLLCRAQDFTSLWRRRLTQLLEHRGLYLQKMKSTLQKLWADMAHYPSELSAEFTQRKKFGEQLMAMWSNHQADSSQMGHFLECELRRLSSLAQSRKRALQSIVEEHDGVSEELQQLLVAAEAQLREETSKRLTLQQEREAGRPRRTMSTMKDNQQLDLQLQQAEDQIKALRAENQQLEEARTKAHSRVSNHKLATQLLQTELQDSRAQVEEKDNIIQTLRSKLGPSENAGLELDHLRTNLFRVEMEMRSASEKHQQEIGRLSTVLTEKEESVRKLKEALRKSQQQGEESFLEGGELCARLTNPKGLVIKSSILLEKGKLEEEVQQLRLQITRLESLVSSQQSDIFKWKSRALKLKVKTKAVVDISSPTCTPTKRGPPMTSDSFLNSPKKLLATPKKVLDSPRKLLDCPKVSLLDSPKSRFFDVAESSELLSRTCPKQFFDNSSLGTVPDGAEAADRKDELWPQSPKQEDLCKTQ